MVLKFIKEKDNKILEKEEIVEKPKRPDVDEIIKKFTPYRSVTSSIILELANWIKYQDKNIILLVKKYEELEKSKGDKK